MGEVGRSWSTMNRAISAIGTCGRNVLGPGRMTCSTGSSRPFASSSLAEQTQHDALLGHDHARLPSGRKNALAYLADRLVQATSRHVCAGDLAGP